MWGLSNLSIRSKVTLATLLTSCIAILAASAIFIIADRMNARNAAIREVSTITEIIGQNSKAAIAFDDAKAAREILSALKSRTNIVSAIVVKKNFELFASFSRLSEPGNVNGDLPSLRASAREIALQMKPGWRVSHHFGDTIDVVGTVVLDGERLGYVALRSDLRYVQSQTILNMMIAVIATLISMLIAILLSYRLQKMITQPISQLAEVMKRVSRDKSYSIRAEKKGDDELGVLIDGFNAMLEQIEANDHALAAKIRAETANRAKSEFLANMSHELRTPLNAIIGFSEIMARKEFGPLGAERYESYANDIHHSGTHLLGIINDILDLTKAEAGKLTLDEEEVDVTEIVNQSIRMLRERAASERVKIAFSVPATPTYLWADGRLVSQALINLLTNAIKFTRENGTVVVLVDESLDGGCEIVVDDSGVGISQPDLVRIREPFTQVANPFTRSHEGTGLGLPLVDQIMLLHEGELVIESELGKGTTAIIRFPDERVVAPSRTEDERASCAGLEL